MLATIFVNPLQFGPAEDFSRYPRTVEADLALLRSAIRQARHIGPDPKNPAALAIQWAANLARPELAALTRLAGLYKAACRTMLAAEFKSRDPSAAAAWERANQRSVERDRGPSLGR